MKKIFAFIGSPKKEDSGTYKLTKMMLDKLVSEDKRIEYEILTAGHVKLNFCQGCFSCGISGICPEDRDDDVGMIKEKMLGADLIVLGSPMYGGGITGQLKTLLDRVCNFYLEKRLAGIPAVTVGTAGMSPCKPMHEFLRCPVNELGMKIIATLDAATMMDGPEEMKKKAEVTAETVLPYLTGEKLVESDEGMEERFQDMKQSVPGMKDNFPAIYEYWKENGMLEMETFDELIQKKREKVTAG